MKPFKAKLDGKRNQLDVMPDIADQPDLLPQGSGPRTMEGLHKNVSVGIGYMKGWNQDIGCVAWDGLMEDLATLEISRAQVWQWLHHNVTLDDGTEVTRDLVRRVFDEELDTHPRRTPRGRTPTRPQATLDKEVERYPAGRRRRRRRLHRRDDAPVPRLRLQPRRRSRAAAPPQSNRRLRLTAVPPTHTSICLDSPPTPNPMQIDMSNSQSVRRRPRPRVDERRAVGSTPSAATRPRTC